MSLPAEASPALAGLAAAATAVVRRAAAAPDATLESPALLRDRARSVVARFGVRGVHGLASVIVKAAARDDDHFFTDWASLDFLTRRLPAPADVAPRLVGGDARARLFVIDDLGGSRSLDDVLREPSRAAALATVAALGRVTARLHAATLGGGAAAHERAFDALRSALPGAPTNERRRDAARWARDAAATLAAWHDALGVGHPARGLDEALRATAAAYAEPGAYLAFTHGDPAPTNDHVDDAGAVRLLDFEYGGFRHALYDPTAWAILCPLPADALDALRDAYRAALATHASPPLAAGPAFDAAWGAMCCWRAVAMLGWLGAAGTVRENAPWVEEWTRREAAIAAGERMAEAVAAVPGAPALAPLGTAGAMLAATMRARWTEYAEGRSVLPRWTAFAE